MTIPPGTSSAPHPLDGMFHQPGRTFDLNGYRTTFAEMTIMPGFFPVEEIADRLPYRLRTLRNWARKGPFSVCFKRIHTGPCGNSVLYVNLEHFACMFEQVAIQSRIQDSNRPVAIDPAMEDTRGLHEFARLTALKRREPWPTGAPINTPACDHVSDDKPNPRVNFRGAGMGEF